jgi:RyR domain
MQHTAKHSIEVKTPERLPKGAAGLWARTVRDHGPPGITAEADLLMGRELVSSRLWCEHGDTGYHYIVPLSRDLEESEADAIAQGWSDAYPEGDFVINWTQRAVSEAKVLSQQAELLDEIADAAAKQYHGRWLTAKVTEGWSFAHKLDGKHKKHPMLQPWENLPESYRVTERERFHTLLRVLEGLDLQITRR